MIFKKKFEFWRTFLRSKSGPTFNFFLKVTSGQIVLDKNGGGDFYGQKLFFFKIKLPLSVFIKDVPCECFQSSDFCARLVAKSSNFQLVFV